MTKDKKYIENLFRNYKKNVARIKILELNQVSDEDKELAAINYTQKLKMGNIQTSNIQSLDDIIVMREKELDQLRKDVATTEILLDSLRKKDKFIIESFYFENIGLPKIAVALNYCETKSVWNNKERILNEMLEVI